jgi:hypothetical protein
VLVVDLELAGDPGAEVLDHDVGVAHEIVEHLEAGFALQVQRHALLVAVERDEVGPLAVEGIARIRGQEFARALAAQRLDLDRLGPEVGEDHGAVGAGEHVRQVEDAHTTQGFCQIASPNQRRAGRGRFQWYRP